MRYYCDVTCTPTLRIGKSVAARCCLFEVFLSSVLSSSHVTLSTRFSNACFYNKTWATEVSLQVLYQITESRLHLNISKWALHSEQTIPTKRQPLAGEVSNNFCGWRVPRGQRDGSLRRYSRFSRLESLLFPSSSSSIVFMRLNGHRSRPTTSQKIIVIKNYRRVLDWWPDLLDSKTHN
jgi:hypothetical protein